MMMSSDLMAHQPIGVICIKMVYCRLGIETNIRKKNKTKKNIA